jgi:hypothetical protein
MAAGVSANVSNRVTKMMGKKDVKSKIDPPS